MQFLQVIINLYELYLEQLSPKNQKFASFGKSPTNLAHYFLDDDSGPKF